MSPKCLIVECVRGHLKRISEFKNGRIMIVKTGQTWTGKGNPDQPKGDTFCHLHSNNNVIVRKRGLGQRVIQEVDGTSFKNDPISEI